MVICLIIMSRSVLLAVAAGLGLLFAAGDAIASCYGTGYSRYCDGNGGSGSTYSNRGGNGSTTYSNNGQRTRTETYTTTPSYGGGYTRQKSTTYY